MLEESLQKFEIFLMIYIAMTLLFTSYKIGEMNGKVQGIDRAIEIIGGDSNE